MRFSVFTASTPEWTPEEAARILADQGWDGIEWRITDQDDTPIPGFWAGNRATWPLTGLENNLAEIDRITRVAGLAYSGIGGYARCDNHVDVERMLAATAVLDASQVRVTTLPLGGDGYRDTFARCREDFEWVAERAEQYGVKALVELHHGTVTASASAAARLVDGLNPEHVGVIHDLGNLVIEGQEDHVSALQLLGAHLAHVHVKNVAWKAADQRDEHGSLIWAHDWAPLADGQADVKQYFRSLQEVGYDGWVTVEDFSTEAPLEERTRANLAYLKAIVAAI